MTYIFPSKKVKIRKPATCFGCGRTFPKGMILRKVTSVGGSGFSTSKWCRVCDEYWATFMTMDDEITMGELKSEDPDRWEIIRSEVEAIL
jgi:hypothetical protein